MSKLRILGKASCVGLIAIVLNLIPIGKTNQSLISIFDYFLMFVVYGLVALQLQQIKRHMKGKKVTVTIIVFLFFFVVDSLMSTLEGNFFIANYQLTHHLFRGLLESVVLVAAVFLLWAQEDASVSLSNQLKDYFKTRTVVSWILRTIILLLSSFVIYMVLGALAYPITGPHMEETIKIPTIFENFMIQFLRGCGYLLVSFPVIVLWDHKKSLKMTMMTSYILFYAILGYSFTHDLPIVLRLMDGLVLSLHLTAFTILFFKLLKKKE